MVDTEEQTEVVEKAKILVLDDHPIVRQGLGLLINQQPDLMVCCEAEDAEGAMNAIGECTPDMLVVDISLKGTNGIEFVKKCLDRYRNLPILVLSMHDESLYAERALRAGARGYIMKKEATEKLLEAIRAILNSGVYLSERMAAKLDADLEGGPIEPPSSPVERLSDRELEVFELIGRGRKTSLIARDLELSVKTVEAHREHIKAKLKLKSANELLRFATQWAEEASASR